jgi:hypothetical protein
MIHIKSANEFLMKILSRYLFVFSAPTLHKAHYELWFIAPKQAVAKIEEHFVRFKLKKLHL